MSDEARDIDLEGMEAHYKSDGNVPADIAALIAEIRGLREQVGELKADFKQMSEQYGAANKFMAEFMEERDAAVAFNKEMVGLLEKSQWQLRSQCVRPGQDRALAKEISAFLKKARP